MARLFLVDGNSYIYRAFFAIRNLKTSYGFPTNAIYGFTSMLLKLLREEKPEYAAVAFDLPAPTFRHKIFSDYKANRPPMPDDLREQFPLMREIISALGITASEGEGYEADDIIATIAKKNAGPGLDVFILSQDKDCLQLVGKNVTVLRENKSVVKYDEETVRASLGVEPGELVDVMALCGDASDNIPGVQGIGMKTAVKLIQRFGSVEGVISGVDGIENEKLRGCLRNVSGRLLLNKELIRLDADVPIETSLEKLRLKTPRKEKAEEIFIKLEFKKLKV